MPEFAPMQTQSTQELLGKLQGRIHDIAKSYSPDEWGKKRQLFPQAEGHFQSNEDLKRRSEELNKELRISRKNDQVEIANRVLDLYQKAFNPENVDLSERLKKPSQLFSELKTTQRALGDNDYVGISPGARKKFEEKNKRYADEVNESVLNELFYRHFKNKFPNLSDHNISKLSHGLMTEANKTAKDYWKVISPETLKSLEHFYEHGTYDSHLMRDHRMREILRPLAPLAIPSLNAGKDGADYQYFQQMEKDGIDPFDPGTKAFYEKKLNTPEKLSGAMDFPDVPAAEKFFAFQKGRNEAFKRGEGFQNYPQLAYERLENPHSYEGLRVAPFHKTTEEAFTEGKKLRAEADTIENARKLRFEGVMKEIEDLKKYGDIAEPHIKQLTSQFNDYDTKYKNWMDKAGNAHDYRQSPYYQHAIQGTENVFNILKNKEDEEFNRKVLPHLRGQFASTNSLNSTSYHQAVNEAKQKHAEALRNQHALMLEKAEERGIRHHQWGHGANQEEMIALQNALSGNVQRRSQTLQAQGEVTRLDRLRQIENEQLKRNAELEKLRYHAGRQESLAGEGLKREDQQRKEIEAARQAHSERPGGPLEAAQLAQMMNAASSVPAGAMPMPQAYPTITPPIAPSASNATLMAGMANTIGQAAGGPFAPQQQHHINVFPQHSGQLPIGYAKGGQVTLPAYEKLMNQYLAQAEAYRQAKDRHAGRPVPVRNPMWSGLGDVAAGIGATLGTGESHLGGWARGISDAGARFDQFYRTQHAMSKEQADMEKTLGDLMSEGAKTQSTHEYHQGHLKEEERHHKAHEGYERGLLDSENKKHEYQLGHLKEEERHHKAHEDYEKALLDLHNKKLEHEVEKSKRESEKSKREAEMERHHKEMEALQKERLEFDKSKETPAKLRQKEDLKKSHEAYRITADIQKDAILYKNIAPFLNTGPYAGSIPYWMQSLGDATIKAQSMADNLSGGFVEERVRGSGGVRSNLLIGLMGNSKFGSHLPIEGNIANASKWVSSTTAQQMGLSEESLMFGDSKSDVLKRSERTKKLSVKEAETFAKQFAKSRNLSKEVEIILIENIKKDFDQVHKEADDFVRNYE